MAKTANWYVVHTYTGYEAMVKDTLENVIKNNNLQEQILDIQIPMEETIEEKNGKKKVVQRKILPCYLFIKLVYSNDLWYLITNTRGVTGFCGPNGQALPLSKDEVQRMGLENKVEAVDFEKGDKVVVVSGPLDGFEGLVTDIDSINQKAKVTVEMFGTETSVDVNLSQLKKVN